MIIDKAGNIFEDRRTKEDRRKNEIDKNGGRRSEDRRKEPQQIQGLGLKKKRI